MVGFIFTCNPSSIDLAAREISSRLKEGKLVHLASGVGYYQARQDVTWEEVTRRLRSGQHLSGIAPIWIRHIHPVQARLPLTRDARDLVTLETGVQPLLMDLDVPRSFSVQTRLLGEGVRWSYARLDINQRLAAVLASWGATLDVRNPYQVLSVTCTQDTAFIGLSAAADNLSNWAGGERRYKRESDQISRAEFKLLEALEVFRIDLPLSGRALDLGAAPGGWTRQLAIRGLDVVAVDPAALDPRVAAMPNVSHIATTLQEAKIGGLFEVLVNDMRMDAVASAQLTVEAAVRLKPGAIGLMTMKLPEKGRAAILRDALEVLAERYTITGARQLFHNRNEVMVSIQLA